MKKKKKTGGRVRVDIETDDQLGSLSAVARYMKIGRTMMTDAKACALRRAKTDPSNPAPFLAGSFTSKVLMMEWFLRNRDFKRTS